MSRRADLNKYLFGFAGKEMEALSVEECRRSLDIAEKSGWFPVLALSLTTGMRPNEYLALKWADINWQRGTASVCRTIQVLGSEWTFDDTKRKRSRRIVKLHNFVHKALRTLKEAQEPNGNKNSIPNSGLIFVSAAGLPLKQRVVKQEFRILLAGAGIRSIRLYDLRHTAATLAIAAGVSVKVISD
jgi:integrase